MMKTVAIIGAGRIFTKHFQAIKFLKKKFKIMGVYDKKNYRNLEAANFCGTKIFKSYDELIKNTNPDIVVILVESGYHLKVCKDIIIKHKIRNFIIEKPIDVSAKKILEFKKFIKDKNINIFTVKQNRFNKSIVKAKELIDKKLIGSIFMISASCKWRRDQSYYNQDQWRGKRNLDGGVLMNQAIHHIDLLLYLVGDIKSVAGYGGTRFVKIQSENIAVASLQFTNGCVGTIEATTATAPKDYEGSITILGSKGIIKIGGFASNKLELFSNFNNKKINLNKYSSEISNVYGQGHKDFYKFVFNFLNNKIKTNEFDLNNSIKSVKVAEAIVKSFKSNSKIIIKK